MIAVFRFRKQVRDMFEQAQNSSRSGFSQHKNREYAAPEKKKKKIDSDVGEYVAFEEIKVSETERHTETSGSKTEIKVESQIEDVEWEEIK